MASEQIELKNGYYLLVTQVNIDVYTGKRWKDSWLLWFDNAAEREEAYNDYGMDNDGETQYYFKLWDVDEE